MTTMAEAVERQLRDLLPVPKGPEGRLVEAMRYSMFAGGKRLRPFLVVTSADLFGVDKKYSLRVAAAIECVHCYSLIHDDLPAMDDDDKRRGQSTCHKKYDEATAILAGDALMTLAFEILADPATHPDALVRSSLIRALAGASGVHGMVGGQMIDLASENEELDMGEITRLQQLKTGALICFSVEAGGILGKASEHMRHLLHGYARDLGLAFQIADDLLDYGGDPEEVGKATGKDAGRGKATFVSLMGPERARRQADILADQAIEHLREFGDKAILLKGLARFVVDRRK
ncbi:MAG: polyprenyl synthetase family protein [Proteobacteria bacterium]|nr:polyprenyl synthetase family protein [Pseudomonadota bacterium]